MSFAPHLELVTEVLPVNRRDFALDAATLAFLNPVSANPLLDGEWLKLNSSYQLSRGSGTQAGLTFQLFAERGRYDTQAIGKVPVLYGGFYEAETDVATLTGLVVGDPLMVGDVTVDALTKQGLIKATGSGTHLVIGWVTRLPGGGKVRFYKNPGPSYLTIP